MPNQLYSKNPAVVTQRRNILFARNNNQGTSNNRFEKGKWVECAECEETLSKTKSIRSNEQIHASDFVTLRFIQLILYESRRSKAVCLTRRCNTMLQSEITGDGMDAVA